MIRLRLLLASLATTILLTGCVTKYVIVNEVAKSQLRVVVFSDNGFGGGQLLEELESKGFDNDENEVLDSPTRNSTSSTARCRWTSSRRLPRLWRSTSTRNSKLSTRLTRSTATFSSTSRTDSDGHSEVAPVQFDTLRGLS